MAFPCWSNAAAHRGSNRLSVWRNPVGNGPRDSSPVGAAQIEAYRVGNPTPKVGHLVRAVPHDDIGSSLGFPDVDGDFLNLKLLLFKRSRNGGHAGG